MIHVPVVLVDEEDEAQRITSTPSNDGPIPGQWYWAKNSARRNDDNPEEPEELLVCATKVGSNFVEVTMPHHKYGYSWRVHLEKFWTDLRHEPNPDQVIRVNITHHQKETQRLMNEVQALTQRLGLTPVKSVGFGSTPSGSGTELAVLSGQHDIKRYGKELVQAKEQTLPALLEAIKESTAKMATWMKAPALPMEVAHEELKGSIDDIDGRILSISLYAGLAEQSVQISKGNPADLADKLHVMQRMLFMDEECLLNYDAGGMEFANIREFDQWLAKPENLNRILPFPRTLVAMRVRRSKKDREIVNILDLYIRFRGEISDAYTFLYVRNGEQLYRLDTEIEFGEMIFPDRTLYDPQEPKMVKVDGFRRYDEMMTVSEFEVRLSEHKDAERNFRAWRKANPKAQDWDNPHRNIGGRFRPDEWKPVDHSNVYFDECMKEIEKKITEFNRIALIIQGLFDRSLVLHPHLPVQSWNKEGFERAIELVMDGTDVLYHGEPPDFQAYKDCCNASLGEGSVTVGQEDFWMAKEAEKESNRLDRDYRNRTDYRPKRFRPQGNPGPGLTATIAKWSPRTRTATFSWERDKRSRQFRNETANCHLSVPASALFNVSAYQQGDFKQFFIDPRTRQQYLKWAPMLLAAEDYVAGKRKRKL